jgi:hypothetical protein
LQRERKRGLKGRRTKKKEDERKGKKGREREAVFLTNSSWRKSGKKKERKGEKRKNKKGNQIKTQRRTYTKIEANREWPPHFPSRPFLRGKRTEHLWPRSILRRQ